MLNIISALLLECPFYQLIMAMKTLLEYASDSMLTTLLIKERAKCRRRNRDDKKHVIEKDCDISQLSTRKQLSCMMPPRYTWICPSKRKRQKQANGSNDCQKNVEKSLLLTIYRDRELQKEGTHFRYLNQLDAFISQIRKRIATNDLKLETPHLTPIFKDKEKKDDGTWLVTCRPLSVYTQLEEKIILSVTSRYLTRYFNRYLHENILSYRPARKFRDKTHYVTDFNDGIEMIKQFREVHDSETIYAADCDIKKFYDIIPHQVVRDCFNNLLQQSGLSDEGKGQVMNVLNAYLDSYSFCTNAKQYAQQNSHVFNKIRAKFHDKDNLNTYQIKWVDEIEQQAPEQYSHLGVPQGGALSLIIANVVLNDVDKTIIANDDPNRLFIRYCDDMILLHTDYSQCCQLMQQYADSLKKHGLFYHRFEDVAQCSPKHFWQIKSHLPFLWGDGEDNDNRYIGFLGYELRRDGRIRLRKSNMQRFADKFKRRRYALRRYRKKHDQEEFIDHQEQVLDTILKGVEFYKSLNPQFKSGSQYNHLKKLRKRTELGPLPTY